MEDIKPIQTIYKTIETTIANLAAAGAYPISGELENSYDVCDGIAFNVVGAGLGSDFKVEVKNQERLLIDSVPASIVLVAAADGTDPNNKFLDTLFSVKSGNRVSAIVTTGAACTADTKVQITFRVRKTNRPVSLPA